MDNFDQELENFSNQLVAAYESVQMHYSHEFVKIPFWNQIEEITSQINVTDAFAIYSSGIHFPLGFTEENPEHTYGAESDENFEYLNSSFHTFNLFSKEDSEKLARYFDSILKTTYKSLVTDTSIIMSFGFVFIPADQKDGLGSDNDWHTDLYNAGRHKAACLETALWKNVSENAYKLNCDYRVIFSFKGPGTVFYDTYKMISSSPFEECNNRQHEFYRGGAVDSCGVKLNDLNYSPSEVQFTPKGYANIASMTKAIHSVPAVFQDGGRIRLIVDFSNDKTEKVRENFFMAYYYQESLNNN